MNIYSKKRGFTLIELLVVIAIIGVLSSVVLASLNSAREKSRNAKRVSDIKQLQLALELYFDDIHEYPPAPVTANVPATATAALTGLLDTTYIAQIPTGPLASEEYYYNADATSGATEYCVGAVLEGSGPVLDTCGTSEPDLSDSGDCGASTVCDYAIAP